MNKADLTARVADRGLRCPVPDADTAVRAVFSAIADALARGETVRIAGFGTFSTRARPARRGRNPATGEHIDIAASTTPAFKAGKTLRDAIA